MFKSYMPLLDKLDRQILFISCNAIIPNNCIQEINNELQDNNKEMMELTNAISMEGYLMKQSPGVMKIFQKRYYAIRSNGQFLVWYGKKPDTVNVQPKGVITIIQIQAIKPDDTDDRIFTLNYNNRWFILRADSKELRDRWLRVITIIMDHLKKALKNKTIMGNQNNSPQDWKFNNASEGVIKSIRMQNEKLIMKQGQDSQLEKSTKYLTNLFGANPSIEIQKYSTHGFLNRKGFITSEIHWYLLLSQFDLADEQDDTFNDTVAPFLEGIMMDGTKIDQNVEAQSSSEEQQQVKNKEVDDSRMQVNCFYEYDIKKNTVTSKIKFVDIISYSKDTSQNPYMFKISYGQYKHNDIEAEQEVKQLTLLSNYMIEIQKWHKAFDIIFRRYSIVKMRQAIVEKRFHKFQVKMLKIQTDTQWRILGSSNKPDYVYINQEIFKVGGLNFLLTEIEGNVISSKMSIVVKQNPNDEGKNKDANIITIPFSEGKKVELVFENKDNLKIFKKKIKKGIKDIEQKKQKKSSSPLKVQNEVNNDTYLIDKRIRESSAAIQMNFYEMMQRPVSTMKQQKQPEKKTFFDKFLEMFCGPPKQQDLYS